MILSISILLIPDVMKGREWRLWEYSKLFESNRKRYGNVWAYTTIKLMLKIYEGWELGGAYES